MTLRPDLLGLGLAALVAVLLTVCAVLGVDAPSFLAELGLVALGVGGGAALPGGRPAAPAVSWSPPAAAVAAPRPRAEQLFDQHHDDGPQTGIFSRVTQ